MDASFYSAVRGAMTQQSYMDILANNIANVNTNGYKSKSVSFQDLIYNNMYNNAQTVTSAQNGTGSIISFTSTDFSAGGINHTGRDLDFAIDGDGFFCLLDPADNSVSYTRDGAFVLSQRADGMYLCDDAGRMVLDSNRNPIKIENNELSALPAIFEFTNTNGMLSVGENRFVPADNNTQSTLSQDAKLMQGYVEGSNVSLADEMVGVIEASRSYSYMLKMIQTSEEIEQTINNLR